jgi:hypothetical protein
MDAVTAVDPKTPFFVGADYNYDTLEYLDTQHVYSDGLAPYHGRLVYEVNMLMPKPWIGDGSVPAGTAPGAEVYPQPDLPTPGDYDVLITPQPGEETWSIEKVFNKHRQDPTLFPALMSRGFISWYLGFAHDFAEQHSVPVLVDQFGASTASQGQLGFEQDVIDVAEGYGMNWCRWVYNANNGDFSRTIEGNPNDVYPFYAAIGAARPGP